MTQPNDTQNSRISAVSRVEPSFWAILVFFLLFSGPPSLRLRSPDDSLQEVLDLSAKVQVLVWVIGGIWTMREIRKDLKQGTIAFGVPGKWGLLMICCMSLSTFVSDAPLLTGFKLGQMLVSLLFCLLFINRYGMPKCIDYIFVGSTLLCIAIAVSALVYPDLVLFRDMDGSMRLRGDPIAVMGIVGTYSMMLLFTRKQMLGRLVFWFLLGIIATLLVLSLTRQAWFLVVAFLGVYLARHSKKGFARNLALLFVASFPLIFVYYILPAVQEYRSLGTVWSLTGRTDLWLYLIGLTLVRSPWIGLGYYSASRVFGPEYNSGMGTAHSFLVEVFLGGGLLSLIPCVALCTSLFRRALKLVTRQSSELEFLTGALFFVTMTLALLGGDIAFGQIGIVFWSVVAALGGYRLNTATKLSHHAVVRVRPTVLKRAESPG
jgi:hypothetical protein